MSAVPNTWDWTQTDSHELPDERLFDDAKTLYDESDFTGDTGDFTAIAYSLGVGGEGPPSLSGAANGLTISYASTPGLYGHKCIDTGSDSPFLVAEIVIDSVTIASGGAGVGVGVFNGTDAYAAVLATDGGWQIAVRKGDNSGANANVLTSSAGFLAGLPSGTRLIIVFGNNLTTFIYKRPADSNFIYLGSSYTAANSVSDFDPEAGYVNQRDPTDGPNQRVGLLSYSTVTGNSFRISRFRVTVMGGVKVREIFPVIKKSDGGPFTEADGRILVTATTQCPGDNTHVNSGTFWGTFLLDPVTGELGPPLRRFVSVRTWDTISYRCGDSDGMILVDDVAGPDYKRNHIYLVTTGTNRQSAGTDAVNNSYRIMYQALDDVDLLTSGVTVLNSLANVTFPTGDVRAPLDPKVRYIGGTWYMGALSSSFDYSVQPTSPFIVSGSSPNVYDTYIIPPAFPFDGVSDWDGIGLIKSGGTWYAITVATSLGNGRLWNMLTGAEIGDMAFSDPGPFIPHPNMFPQFLGTLGVDETTLYRRVTHDNDFTRWGKTFITNSWFFGDTTVHTSDEAVTGWEFTPKTYSGLAGGVGLIGPGLVGANPLVSTGGLVA